MIGTGHQDAHRLVDLHVHFEGAIPNAVLAAIAARNGIHLPPSVWCVPRSFDSFFCVYRARASALRSLTDVADAAQATAEWFRDHGIVYTEIHVSPGLIARNFPTGIADILLAVHRGAARVAGTEIHLIVDVVRHHPMHLVDEIVAVAIELQTEAGIVALGLGGREETSRLRNHRSNFTRAAAQGLRVVAHAGEQSGSKDVAACLDLLGAERIGHGLAAVDDPALMRRLSREGIPVEVCLTSNLRLCGIERIGAHPLALFLDAGVPVILGTDDPAIFDTTLRDEYDLLDKCGLGPEIRDEVARSAWHYRFVTDEPAASPPQNQLLGAGR